MIKARTFAAAAILSAAPLVMGATTAFASTAGSGPAGSLIDATQTLAGEQATFIQGGDDLGRGAGELVSSAYLGAPQAVLDIPAHVLGIPKQLLYIP